MPSHASTSIKKLWDRIGTVFERHCRKSRALQLLTNLNRILYFISFHFLHIFSLCMIIIYMIGISIDTSGGRIKCKINTLAYTRNWITILLLLYRRIRSISLDRSLNFVERKYRTVEIISTRVHNIICILYRIGHINSNVPYQRNRSICRIQIA